MVRVAHFDELDAECINAYYRYGSALLEKAQAEADPLGNMPKKEGDVQQESSNKDDSVKNTVNGESMAASVVSSNRERQGSCSSGQEGTEIWELSSFKLMGVDFTASLFLGVPFNHCFLFLSKPCI